MTVQDEEEMWRSNDAHISELLRDELLPLVRRVRTESQAWGIAGKRGDFAEHLTRIDDLAAAAEASTEALARLVAFHAQEKPLDLSMVDLGDVLMTLLARWKSRAPAHAFELALPGEIPLVSADLLGAETALNALIEDTLALTAPGGSIRVSIRPEADSIEIAMRPDRAKWPHVPTPHEGLTGVVTAPDAEVATTHSSIKFSLARSIVGRHGGRAWLERDAVGDGVTLRASWKFAASLAGAPHPLQDVQSGEVQLAGESPRMARTPSTPHTALVCEPDARMARYLRVNLDARQIRCIMATSLDQVPHLTEVEEPDFILLDATDPNRAASTLARVIQLTEAPVLMLTSEYDAETCARLLDAGASDYISKPLHIDELFARMRVALRTSQTQGAAPHLETRFRSGELTIDFTQHRVKINENDVTLSKTEFKLLRALAQNAGKVLTHEWLLERVWGAGYRHETEFIWVYIRRLRRKIEPDPKHPRYVITVPGVGYRLVKG